MNRRELGHLLQGLLFLLCLISAFYLANYTAVGASFRTKLYQLDFWGDHAHTSDSQPVFLPMILR
jgi:hypothetical protein